MVRYDELSDEENVLLEVERGALTSNDVTILLGNINLSFASNLLRDLWGRRLLTRKKIQKENGGIKYLYNLSIFGEKVLHKLHGRGY